jgi:predicted amidohydrolase
MKVAAVQHDIIWEEPGQTRDRVRSMIAEAVAAGATLVALPEMFATGFSMRPEKIAEDEGGPTEQFLLAEAAAHGVHLVASVAQRGADGAFRNNAILAAPDGTVVRYPKIHPFSYAGEHEKYAAGNTHVTVDVAGVRVTLFVCYDLRFADEFWTCGPGTDLFVVVANWPASRHEHWRLLLRARAVENQAYVLGVNRVGAAKELDHAGGSVVVDPLGAVLVEAGAVETVVTAPVDPARVQEIRTKFPFLADRR